MTRSDHEALAAEPLSQFSSCLKNDVYNDLHIADDNGIFSKSNRKKSISQYCAVNATGLVILAFGTSLSFTTILIPELKKNHSDVVATEEDITWISSMNLLTIPLGAVVSGSLAQLLGRRGSLILSSLAFIGAWIVLHYAHSVLTINSGLFMLGVICGLTESPGQVYVMEVCEPRVRGSGSACMSGMFALGFFLEVVVGSYVHWRTLALINIGPILLALITMSAVPETPHWFASKGRYEEARRSLSWLRGWTTPDQVEHEYQSIVAHASKYKSQAKSGSRTSSFLKKYFRKEVSRPFALVSFMFVIGMFNGQAPITTYAVLIFGWLKSPVNEYTITIVMTGLFFIGIVGCAFFVTMLGRRRLTLWSLLIAGVATLVVAIYEFMHSRNIVTKESYNSWIPVTAILTSVFATAAGIKCTPWILAGEIFPSDVRSVAAGIIGAICNLIAALANKTFLGTIHTFSFAGAFFIYALVNFVGWIVLHYTMPETGNLTLVEIEELFSGKKESRDQKVVKDIELDALTKTGVP